MGAKLYASDPGDNPVHFSPAQETPVLDLSGEWRFSLDRGNSGEFRIGLTKLCKTALSFPGFSNRRDTATRSVHRRRGPLPLRPQLVRARRLQSLPNRAA